MSCLASIRLHGVRQNNLKGFDIEIPIGKLVVVTGLSGAGKSSLVFETLHAEGQRRYVETFSPYTRQFLELLPEAAVDSIENIRPSIAVKQGNTVKTSRSTVGTMTELCDWMKNWFAHAAELIDPATGKALKAYSPATVWKYAQEHLSGKALCVAFALERPKKMKWMPILAHYAERGFTKIIVAGKLENIDEADAENLRQFDKIFVVGDRLRAAAENRNRFIEAAGTAMRLGGGQLFLFEKNEAGAFEECGVFSEKLVSPVTRKQFRPASPALFSFNSPIGACPRCRGFGRVITLDWKKVIPDENKTLAEGVCAAFSGAVYGTSQDDLLRACRRKKIPLNVAWKDLSPVHRNYILDGDADWSEDDWNGKWYGIKRFFDWLESTSYKMHVRVFLSRFRAYVKCPDCGGTRFQPESLAWKFRGNSLPELFAKSVDELLALLPEAEKSEDIALAETRSRLGYLREVGLGFLTLDRQSRTLSGGEVQRVNLTACLGASLSNTLFILDEPSVGLHPRDLAKMISILKKLVAGGNTVVVVEHDESVMRAADYLIEIGPRPGAEGGNLVYAGEPGGILKCENSITGAWLSGRRERELATVLKSDAGSGKSRKKRVPALHLARVNAHNLCDFACEIPLRRLVGICGVSGSGKSTLINNVLAQFSSDRDAVPEEDDFELPPCMFKSDMPLREIVLVDQAPLSKTPRSNPAVYCGVWTEIRKLLAGTPEAQAAGITAGSFSYNSGDGRCPHCNGTGWETVEMQFLSDVFIPCPVCEGRRFRDEILQFRYNGKNATEILALTVGEALKFFAGNKKIEAPLALLEEIGLGYLTLGQPLNTLSGGESQRLKLTRHLGGIASFGKDESAGTSLLLLDEPTTGLHREDTALLIKILKKLVAAGNSVVVVEHQSDVLGACDWLLELGPEGGKGGGKLVFAGTPFDRNIFKSK